MTEQTKKLTREDLEEIIAELGIDNALADTCAADIEDPDIAFYWIKAKDNINTVLSMIFGYQVGYCLEEFTPESRAMLAKKGVIA